MRWRLYYPNGETFDDGDGAPWESPQYPVLCAQPWRTGNEQVMINGDYLLYRDDLGQWTQCGTNGLPGQLYTWARWICAVRETLWVPGTAKDGEYGDILQRARLECGQKI